MLRLFVARATHSRPITRRPSQPRPPLPRRPSRPSTQPQNDELTTLFQTELEHYRKDIEAAKALAINPLAPLAASADVAEMAAWTVVANVLLNLDSVLAKG